MLVRAECTTRTYTHLRRVTYDVLSELVGRWVLAGLYELNVGGLKRKKQ